MSLSDSLENLSKITENLKLLFSSRIRNYNIWITKLSFVRDEDQGRHQMTTIAFVCSPELFVTKVMLIVG